MSMKQQFLSTNVAAEPCALWQRVVYGSRQELVKPLFSDRPNALLQSSLETTLALNRVRVNISGVLQIAVLSLSTDDFHRVPRIH